jgi:hypothetical protein
LEFRRDEISNNEYNSTNNYEQSDIINDNGNNNVYNQERVSKSAYSNINADKNTAQYENYISTASIKEEVEYILNQVNNTTNVFYEKLLSQSGGDNIRFYTVGDRVYSIGDIINENSDISVQNISRIIEKINSETDVDSAVAEINKVYLKVKTISNMQSDEQTDINESLSFIQREINISNTQSGEQTDINDNLLYTQNENETTRKNVVNNYIEYLEKIINDLEDTKVINQVITQNNDFVEKYIHGEVERILKTNSEYEEKLITENEHRENILENDIELYQRDIVKDNINEIMTSEKANINESVVNTVSSELLSQVSLVHATRENIQEGLIEEVTQNIKRDTAFGLNTYEQTNETQVTQSQLTQLKGDLIRESEENITRLVNQNIQTQVHTISDMVYLELEKRLRNEQRRRGY